MRVWQKQLSIMSLMVKRLFDLGLALVLGLLFLIPIIFLCALIRLTSSGPAIYWSDRVGKNSQIFKMAKLRTMYIDTPVLATHLLANAHYRITPIGGFLRKTSLDELPQLWNVLKGEMSFVGPRPALFNQDHLIALRKQYGVDTLLPGITGWAQLNGRDELADEEKVDYDRQYLERHSIWFDLRIMVLTIVAVLKAKGISH